LKKIDEDIMQVFYTVYSDPTTKINIFGNRWKVSTNDYRVEYKIVEEDNSE